MSGIFSFVLIWEDPYSASDSNASDQFRKDEPSVELVQHFSAGDQLDELVILLEFSQLTSQLFHCINMMHSRQSASEHGYGV